MLYFEYCVTRQDLSLKMLASIVLQGLYEHIYDDNIFW